jgi:thiamine-phosphate pyrophosphorylase
MHIERFQYVSQQTTHASHLDNIHQALLAGCRWIQLRVKNQPEPVVLSYAAAAKALCDAFQARLIVNDFPGVAKRVQAYGVHVGLQDLPIREVRKQVGKGMVIGGTANTFAHIRQRVAEGADYIGLGPFRFTTTKEKLSPILGLSGYTSLVEQMRAADIHLPLIAIGGIGLDDVRAILQTGVHGIAVSGLLTEARDKAKMVEHIYQAIQENHFQHDVTNR